MRTVRITVELETDRSLKDIAKVLSGLGSNVRLISFYESYERQEKEEASIY